MTGRHHHHQMLPVTDCMNNASRGAAIAGMHAGDHAAAHAIALALRAFHYPVVEVEVERSGHDVNSVAVTGPVRMAPPQFFDAQYVPQSWG